MNKNLAAFTFCLIVMSVLVSYVTVQYTAPSFLFLIVTVLASATFLVYFFMLRTSGENFIKNYLLTIVIKLLAGGLFIGAVIFADIEGAEQNAITFMISYLLFTMLEVGFLFGKFNKS
jgi:hypothetical protein